MKNTEKLRILPALAMAAALVLAGVPAAPALAADAPAPAHPNGPGGILKCLRVVDLTDQQKADIKAILEGEKDTLKGLHEAIVADRDALKALFDSENPDPCQVGTAVLKLHADRGAMRDEIAKIRSNVEALLTPEQKAKLAGCLAILHGDAPADPSTGQ